MANYASSKSTKKQKANNIFLMSNSVLSLHEIMTFKLTTSWNMQDHMGKTYKIFLLLVAFLLQTHKFKDFFEITIWKNGVKKAFSTKIMLLCK